MMEKKNIDRLFQEKFKDFEVTPPSEVWEAIEERLQKKKKRRVIPFWWKLSGVAALLAIGTLTTIMYKNQYSETEIKTPGVVIQESQEINKPTESQFVEKNSVNEQKNNEGTVEIQINGEPKKPIPQSTTTSIVYQKAHLSFDKKQKSNISQKQEGYKDLKTNDFEENDPKVIFLKNKEEFEEQNSSVAHNNLSKNKNVISSALTERALENKTDSTILAIVEQETRVLEKLLQQEKETEENLVAVKENKWQIVPNLAPVYFNSLSNGSPIDNQFIGNDKSFENSVSFGVGITYNVTPKWTLRSGINKVALAYNTNDIAFFADLSAKGFSTIDSNNSFNQLAIVNTTPDSPLEMIGTLAQNQNKGVINQKFGYMEVPLEMSYQLVDKRFKMAVIGGVSTFFLTENEVAVVSQGFSNTIGKANNLNTVHFSSNIGLGFQYRLWKNFNFNVEPLLKYQINTFRNDAGNFKPYFIGVYSGISFSF